MSVLATPSHALDLVERFEDPIRSLLHRVRVADRLISDLLGDVSEQEVDGDPMARLSLNRQDVATAIHQVGECLRTAEALSGVYFAAWNDTATGGRGAGEVA